jgi:hypothetical protein
MCTFPARLNEAHEMKILSTLLAILVLSFTISSDCSAKTPELKVGDEIRVHLQGPVARDFSRKLSERRHASTTGTGTVTFVGRIIRVGKDETYSLLSVTPVGPRLVTVRLEIRTSEIKRPTKLHPVGKVASELNYVELSEQDSSRAMVQSWVEETESEE